jgi:hypothetical protein
LDRHAEVVIELKESNTASRAALYLSQANRFPTSTSAVWSSESSDPRKIVVVLPTDEKFVVGPLYIAVHYTGTSGGCCFSLKATLRDEYLARWCFPATLGIYEGAWRLDQRHGRGRMIYYADPAVFEKYRHEPPSFPDLADANGGGAGGAAATPAATESVDAKMRQLTQEELRRARGVHAASSYGTVYNSPLTATAETAIPTAPLYAIPDDGCECYEGEWRHGEKEGEGVYTWPDMQYIGNWRAGERNGKGKLTVGSAGVTYNGEWKDDNKHGFGVQVYEDGSRYEGGWERNARDGRGEFTYPNGVRLSGTWRQEVLVQDADHPVVVDYPNGEHYEGEWRDDLRHGRGVLRDANGLTYEGEFEKGKRHGSGVWNLPRGIKLRGTWEHDVRHVKGSMFEFPNNDLYRGEWDEARHVRHGHGSCAYADGSTYEGHWVDDQRCGEGEQYLEGETYKGHFRANMRDGRGRCEYNDVEGTSIYDGEWSRDRRHGQGKLLYPDEAVYEGGWVDNERQGEGTMLQPLEDPESWTYSGGWLRNKRHGYGVLTMNYVPDEAELMALAGRVTPSQDAEGRTTLTDQYEGEWQDDVRHGEGTMRYARGDTIKTEWRDNARVDGEGECHYADGSFYSGRFKHEKRHGRGRCDFPDGSSYDGEWHRDAMHGAGSMTLSNGDVFTGTWQMGKRKDGHGECVYDNGNKYTGEWLDGKPHGKGVLVFVDSSRYEGLFVHGDYVLTTSA